MQDTNFSGLSSLWAQADMVGVMVILILLLMSVISWYVITTKFFELWQTRRLTALSANSFWSAQSRSSAVATLAQFATANPFSRMAQLSMDADDHYCEYMQNNSDEGIARSEFVTRALRRALALEAARQESGLTILASIAGTAPFVGLFGTVWGIYHALLSIGARGQNSLDAVAGPLGEALIMTAAGLAVAIPAVLGYNALLRSNRNALAQLDTLAFDLHTYITTGARVGSHTHKEKIDYQISKQSGAAR